MNHVDISPFSASLTNQSYMIRPFVLLLSTQSFAGTHECREIYGIRAALK